MSTLLKAFSGYGDFKTEFYFITLYNAFPSTVEFRSSVKLNKTTILDVLSLLDLSDKEYRLVKKEWDTKDDLDANINDDYASEYLYVGIDKSVLISLISWESNFEVDFLYDVKDQETEEWVLQTNDRLRKQYGEEKSPMFSVLTKANGCFMTQKVKTEKITLDLDRFYNDDFKAVYQRIDEAITAKESGLIMLYGKSGTGKTTYIKSLIANYDSTDFIFIQNEFVKSLLDPEFISFLLRKRNAVLVIEDAEKVITSRERSNEDSVVSTILQLTDGLFSDFLNLKVICTFNTSLEKIDTALLRKGRMIAMYEFDKLSLEKTNQLLESQNAKMVFDGLTVADIFNQEEEKFSQREERKIGF